MLMRFDNAAISGLFSHDGYVDLSVFDPIRAARFILERVRLGESRLGESK
jgi:hypothetical protein